MAHRCGISLSAEIQIATVFDLPGCSYTAATLDEVRAMLPLVVAEHVGWLAGHGEAITVGGLVEVIEEVDPSSMEGVEGEFIFADDRLPLGSDDLVHGLRCLEYSRHDLRAAVDGLPDEIFDWRPPRSAMLRIDPWKPEPLTIREIVSDVASAESYYRTGLRDGSVPDDRGPETLDLGIQRAKLIEELGALDEASRARVFRPIRSWQTGAELWTARKVLRRVVSHERFHTAEIRQRLTWLLLGVPEFPGMLPKPNDGRE